MAFAALVVAWMIPTAAMPPPSSPEEPPVVVLPYLSEVPKAGLSPELFDRPTKPKANLVRLFSTDDYPLEAIRNAEEGTVAVVLKVRADGRVADCVVVGSSRSPSLDSQTCRILWLRARFVPARDSKDRPVESAVNQRIRWELPQAPPLPIKPWSVRFQVDFVKDGGVVACHVEATGAVKADQEQCKFFSWFSDGLLTKLRADAGYARQKMVMETIFAPGISIPATNPPSGMRLHGRQVGRLTIDESGEVIQCKVVETEGLQPPWEGCPDLVGDLYEKPAISAGAIEATIARNLFVSE